MYNIYTLSFVFLLSQGQMENIKIWLAFFAVLNTSCLTQELTFERQA